MFSKKLVAPCIYSLVKDYNEGLYAFQENSKWGFANEIGEIIIPCKYSWVNEFVNGKSLVNIGDQFIILGKNGEQLSFKKGITHLTRINNIYIEIREIKNENRHSFTEINVFKETIHIGQFIIEYPPDHLHPTILSKGLIEIRRFVFKYNSSYSMGGVFKFDGTKLTERETKKILEEEELLKKEKATANKNYIENHIPIDKTLWTINEKKLLYDRKVVYEYKDDWFEFLEIHGFYSGLGLLKVTVDIDPEFGIRGDSIGYIDIFGNIYFEDS
jgi:hypothetical protein